MPTVDISPLRSDQIGGAADVLVRAFDDSPIMVYLLPKARTRAIGMRAFFTGGLRDAHRHGEAWVVTVDHTVAGAAVWLGPGAYPPNASRQRRQLARMLALAPVAPGALGRSLRYLRGVEAVHPKAEHWYLATLGVDPLHQGQGLGTRLLDAVLPRADEGGRPTYLETDKERNLAYYARQRFAELDQVFPAADGPPTWTMWRDPVER